MLRNPWLFAVLAVSLLLMGTGCERDGPSEQVSELQKQLLKEEEEVKNLESLLEAERGENQRLKTALIDAQHVTSDMERALEQYPWLRKLNDPGKKWDKVVISRYEGDPAAFTLEDPLFLTTLNTQLFNLRSVNTVSYPSGYHSDIEEYTYELHEGDKKYSVRVVHRGVIEAGRNEQYFEVDENVHQLGVAFMPKPSYVLHEGLLAKMTASGAVRRGDTYVTLSAFRVLSKSAPLVGGEVLSKPPENAGEMLETFTFYYYGEELKCRVYKDYVRLTDDSKEEWIHKVDVGITMTTEAG
jgi:hypothetical protein